MATITKNYWGKKISYSQIMLLIGIPGNESTYRVVLLPVHDEQPSMSNGEKIIDIDPYTEEYANRPHWKKFFNK